MSLIENIDFEAVARRTITRGLAQFANLVDAAVRGGVNFDHIHRTASADFAAGVALAAGLGSGRFRAAAVQGHGQDTGNGRLSNTAMAAENIAVRDALLLNGVFKSARDVVLPDHIRKSLGTVFTRKDLIAHEKTRL